MENLAYMPALMLDEQRELESIEQRLRVVLSRCGDDLFDSAKAFEYLRTYSVEFFEAFYRFYSRYPAYKDRWFGASQHKAVDRVFACVANNYNARSTFRNSSREDLLKTIEEHHKHFGIEAVMAARASKINPLTTAPLTGRQTSAYAAAGIDISSGSALLMMAHTAAQGAHLQPSNVPSVMAPVLTDTRTEVPGPSSIGVELRRLLVESRLRPEDIAEEIDIAVRNVYRHLAGETVPSLVNVGKYEKALSKRLGRSVNLPTPEKRQNASITSAKRQ